MTQSITKPRSSYARTDDRSRCTSLLAVRRGSSTPASDRATVACGSAELYASAVQIYHDLFKRAPELEPDMGLGERYESGRRTLMRRQAARRWRIAARRVAAAEALLARARTVQGDAVIDVIETLPVELLVVLDRRRGTAPDDGRHHRRWSDAPASSGNRQFECAAPQATPAAGPRSRTA